MVGTPKRGLPLGLRRTVLPGPREFDEDGLCVLMPTSEAMLEGTRELSPTGTAPVPE